MAFEPIAGSINLRASKVQNLGFKDGQIIILNIIKELAPGKWAIGIKGNVFIARTSLNLTAGETLKAIVSRDGPHMILKLNPTPEVSLKAILQQQGLSLDSLGLVIVSSLIRNNVRLDEKIILNLKEIIAKLKGKKERNAQAAAMLLAKGIQLDSQGFPQCLAELSDEKREKEEKRQKRKPLPELKATHLALRVKEEILKNYNKTEGLTHLINLLPSRNTDERWLVVPYQIKLAEQTLSGKLFFLLEEITYRLKRLVVRTEDEKGLGLFFVLNRNAAKGYTLKVFTDNPELKAMKLNRFAETIRNLAKLDVICDDILRDGDSFNGFASEASQLDYKAIDTEG